MSIDYDRLRELADKASPSPWGANNHGYMGGQAVYNANGVPLAFYVSGNNAELVALAPDMARELLRLRRELTDLRDLMWTNAGHLRKDGHAIAADWTENHALRLAQIMKGDTE